jgi:hypothetical protein
MVHCHHGILSDHHFENLCPLHPLTLMSGCVILVWPVCWHSKSEYVPQSVAVMVHHLD